MDPHHSQSLLSTLETIVQNLSTSLLSQVALSLQLIKNHVFYLYVTVQFMEGSESLDGGADENCLSWADRELAKSAEWPASEVSGKG